MSELGDADTETGNGTEAIIKEIIALERGYFFEKRRVTTERQRKLRELIERHTKMGGGEDDS